MSFEIRQHPNLEREKKPSVNAASASKKEHVICMTEEVIRSENTGGVFKWREEDREVRAG